MNLQYDLYLAPYEHTLKQTIYNAINYFPKKVYNGSSDCFPVSLSYDFGFPIHSLSTYVEPLPPLLTPNLDLIDFSFIGLHKK